MGRPVRCVEPGAPAASLRGLPAPSFAYAKVPPEHAAAVGRFEAAGFRVVDVSVTFSRAAAAPALPEPTSPVEAVTARTAAAVLDIAGSCFKFSRFHLDPEVPGALAHRIKREWIRSYVEGRRGAALHAVLRGRRPAGFLAVLRASEGGRRQAVIDLIGVGKAHQGRGLGRDLVRFFVNAYRGSCDELLVGTQAANIPSLRLYESCGFRAVRTAIVLHKHALAAGGR